MDDRRPHPADESRPDETAEAVADADATDGAPLGGDDTTEHQLDADNDVEKDMLKSLDPDDNPV